ncbi:SIMPL domain-containing protein [Aquimarina litoralis]|uniref:SIMPL domain-containing protein n=1 Tax=Aquimarina litoralis TaxID=584605 RepID=UPI001C56A85D|nr:SIMPL domain-containing protein [Aquimarina litoralis]MBW1298878.1 DUF541 domain-containing protein [Aquimarina litoralis]
MKYLLFILTFCVNISVAQDKSTITVIGEATKTININNYVVNVEFREIFADNYGNSEAKSVEQLEKEYASMLSKEGVDFSKFREDLMYRITSHEYTNARFYFYVTTSLEEVRKILSKKMKGSNSRIDIIAKQMTNEESSVLTNFAIEDAKDKAQKIVEKLNKRIGTIKTIEDINYKTQNYYSNRIKEPIKYHVKVTFEIE